MSELTREALYDLVWSEPMIKVAARCGVSSSYMARVCERLNVPRPERGYWAKLLVGKAAGKPPLPEALPGGELAWSRDGHPVKRSPALPRPPAKTRKKRARVVPPDSPETHRLVIGAKALFEEGRLSYDLGYLKPYKRLLVDLVVSKDGLDRALSFANQLFLSLEANGYRVAIAPAGMRLRRAEVDERENLKQSRAHHDLWSPWRCTVLYIGTVAIGLTIIEMSENATVRYVSGKYVREEEYVASRRPRYAVDNTRTTTKDFPTGRLCLQAYSPDWRATWLHQWRESKAENLAARIPGIIRKLEQSVTEIAHLVEEGERQAELERQRWEIQQERWRREEAQRRAAKADADSKAELLAIIQQWAESRRLEEFFIDAERRATALPESDRAAIMKRLKLARDLTGSTDALERLLSWRSPAER